MKRSQHFFHETIYRYTDFHVNGFEMTYNFKIKALTISFTIAHTLKTTTNLQNTTNGKKGYTGYEKAYNDQ